MMNKLEHLLTILGEESSELHQDICKALRFGMNDSPPSGGLDNTQLMFKEFNDILALAEMINEYMVEKPWDKDDRSTWVTYSVKGILYRDDKLIAEKKAKVEKWLLYSESKGRLTE